MKISQGSESVFLEISNDEALVFFDWLTRFNEKQRHELFQDQSEQRVLFDIEAMLEKVISETLAEDYFNILSKAREKIRDSE